MKCEKCNYENRDDALWCGLCGLKLKDASVPVSPAPSLNEQGDEQLKNDDLRPSKFENIKDFLGDHKGLVVICIVLVSFCLFFSTKSFVSAQKHKGLEDKVAELSYPIYAAMVTGKKAGMEEDLTKIKKFTQDYADQAGPKEFQEIMAAINRGQEKARKKIKQNFNVQCPYF